MAVEKKVTRKKSKKKSATKKKVASTSRPRKPAKPYPSVPFEKALEVAIKIKELNGGNPWTPDEVAKAISQSPKSSDFYYVTAAARDYGLTVGTRDTATISLTELGREIVYAPSPEVERTKKIEAFHNIDIFGKVLKHYKGSDLPEMKYLGNTLQREFKLAPEHHEDFSTAFRETTKYLGITTGEELDNKKDSPSPSTVVVGEPGKKTKLTAFVIMPFSEKNPDRAKGFFEEVLRSLITPAGLEAGFKVETANRQGSDIIQSTIINDLLEADLVIADLTDHNPNVLFELGLRMAEDKPVALIKAVGTGKVFDVDNMLRVFEYSPNLWRSSLDTDLPNLTKHIKATWDNRGKDQSYMKILRRDPSKNSAQ